MNLLLKASFWMVASLGVLCAVFSWGYMWAQAKAEGDYRSLFKPGWNK